MKSFLKTLSILLFLSIFQVSCSKYCNGKQYQFRSRLEVIIPSNDTLQLYYLTKDSKEFSEKFSLKLPVKGSSKKQFIEFCLPVEPIGLRIYFRENTVNKKVKILSALFENQERQMFLESYMFHLYFIGSKNFKYSKKSNSYIFQTVPDKVYRPFINARKVMKDRLVNRLRL